LNIPLEASLPTLLAIAGGALQYLIRQFKGVPEVVYHLAAVLLAAGAYFLVHDMPQNRETLIRFILWMSGGVATVWGGTFGVSSAAKRVVESGANSEHMLIPLTNSK